jgi:hypothetical protein
MAVRNLTSLQVQQRANRLVVASADVAGLFNAIGAVVGAQLSCGPRAHWPALAMRAPFIGYSSET